MPMIASNIEPVSGGRHLLGGERGLPELLGNLLARAGLGLILATADRGIVYSNDLADSLVRARITLRCERTSISVKDFNSPRQLQSLINYVSRGRDESAQGGTLIMRDEDGALSLAVHVVPLSRNFGKGLFNGEQFAVGFIIVDCRQAHSERIRAFASLFALTPGEARVAAQLVSGGGLREASSYLKIALSTARSHLRNIFEKTGTHSQAEFIKAFCQVTLPRPAQALAADTNGGAAAGGCRISPAPRTASQFRS
jgi:DNA-binding CsgD family transcriptional regulator